MTMRLLPMGALAVLVEDPPGDAARWSLGLRTLAIEGVVDVVPAARTVLVTCQRASQLAALIEHLAGVVPAPPGRSGGDVVVIPTVYDGADLIEVATATGLSVDEVIERHVGATFEVALCGFAPGFAYLRGLPPELRLPRRATPRQRVPAGSVAIAAEYGAVYPAASPGGWHLLGRTERVMFDVEADQPALLRPGGAVRFEPA